MKHDDIYKLHSTTLETVMVSIEKQLDILISEGKTETESLERFLKTCVNAQGFAVERELGA